MRQVLFDQPGVTGTTGLLAAEIRDRGLYRRRDGKFADWKQINKQAVDSPDIFRFLGPGMVELIEVGSPTEMAPVYCAGGVENALETSISIACAEG